jgi:transcription antitermination protein NusB
LQIFGQTTHNPINPHVTSRSNSGASKQWNIERMGVVDRNVIRLAIYEINHRPDVPAAVSINEAVDIANYFSDDDSSRFVNGILDQILRNHSGASDREDPVTPG